MEEYWPESEEPASALRRMLFERRGLLKIMFPRAKTKIIGRNRKGGFTLVETLITTSIIIILLAIGLAGILRYRDYLRITELDNMARSIYMAAQNRAVLLDNDRRFQTLVKGGCTSFKLTVSGKEEERWYIDSRETATAATLDDLLPVGTIDPALQNGRFYIVYEAESASVTDVFYVEKTDYNLATEFSDIAGALKQFGADDKRDARMNNKKDNKSVMVGWFGSNAAAPRDKKLKLPDPGVEILIVNGNELTLQVTYTMPSNLPDGVKAEDVTRVPSVVLKYKENDESVTSIDLLASDLLASGRWGYDYKIETGTVQKATYTWVLDSLDLNSSGGSQRFKDLGPEFESDPDLGRDFEVIAGLTLKATGCSDSSYSVSAANNSLFAEDTHNGSVAYIENLRHLQNLHTADSGVGSGIKTAEQTKNIDAGTLRNNKDNDNDNVIKTDYEFSPIENGALLCYRDERTGAATDGKVDIPYSIENLNVAAAGTNGAGLFGKASGTNADNAFLFQNVCLINPKVTGGDKAAGALVGSAENVRFENCQASGVQINGNTAGGLAGSSTEAVEFVDCIVAKVAEDSLKNNVCGEVHAGGMVGNATGKCLFQGCQVSGTQVTGTGNVSVAGGMAGSTKGVTFGVHEAADGNTRKCTVEKITVKAKGYAGGMAGYNEESPASFTNCEVLSTTVTSENGIAGGIAGGDTGNTAASFEGCGIKGLTVTSISKSAGGMLGGKSQGSITFTGCTVGEDGAALTITGGSNAGGMLGTAKDAATATFTNCRVGKADATEKKVTVMTATGCAGGLAGNMTGGCLFQGCQVSGTQVTGTGDASVAGGMSGSTRGVTFEVHKAADNSERKCTVEKITVEAKGYAGGMAGYNGESPASFTNCEVLSTTVTSENGIAGGIAGGDTGNTAASFEGCGIKGLTVTSTSDSAGGMLGCKSQGSVTFTGCTVGEDGVDLTITGESNAGGMLGTAKDAATATFTNCRVGKADATEKKVIVKAKKRSGGMAGIITAGGLFQSCEVVGAEVSDTGEGKRPNNADGTENLVPDSNAGGLAGDAGSAKFANCVVRKITVTANGLAGGLAGAAGSSYSSCQVFNAVIEGKGERSYAGGLAGDTGANQFTNCTVGASNGSIIEVTAGLYAGGLTGYSWGGATFSGCEVFDTTVETTASYQSSNNPSKDMIPYAGGLTGASGGEKVNFENCYVSGGSVKGSYCAGGMAGHNFGSAVTFENCGIKHSTVTADGRSAGGLLAFKSSDPGTEGEKNVKFIKCTVGKFPQKDGEPEDETKAEDAVTITAQSRAGGLLGYVDNNCHAIFSGCQVVNATVKADPAWDASAGGLAGKTGKNTQFSNCTAGGKGENENISVTAFLYAGGLSGASVDSLFRDCQAVNTTVHATAWNGRAGGLVGRLVNYLHTEEATDPTEISGCKVYWTHSLPETTTDLQTVDYKIRAAGSEGMAGGLVGEIATAKATIQNSFAASFVYGGGYVGGLIGYLPEQVTENQWGNSSEVKKTHPVSVEKSYADCYIMLEGGTGWYAAGGLVGSYKNAKLTLKDVYAAGFITIKKAKDTGNYSGDYAAGLCGGGGDQDELSIMVENAYAAMYYDQGNRIPYIFPLAKKATSSNSFYLYNKNYVVTNAGGYYEKGESGTHYEQMASLGLGAAFVRPPNESHPYNIDGGGRSTYPFPGLTGLPHYGDWVTEDMASAINAIDEELEAVSDKDALEGAENPEETPEEETPPAADETQEEEPPPAAEEGPKEETLPVADEKQEEETPPASDETPKEETPSAAEEGPKEEVPTAADETPEEENPPAAEEDPKEEVSPVAEEGPGKEEDPETDRAAEEKEGQETGGEGGEAALSSQDEAGAADGRGDPS